MVPEAGEEMRSEGQLMAGIAAGDPQPLGELYRRHARAVRAIIGYFASEMTDADVDDVTHETFVSLSRAAARYTEQAQFKPFLFRIAVNRARDWQRKAWLRRTFLRSEAAEPDTMGVAAQSNGPTRILALREATRQVLHALPAAQRAVLVLHVVEGLKCEEIAAVLGVRPKTVRTRLHRARRALRQNVEAKAWREAMNEVV
jgi:RNA polymerase sigma-70 factor (ECF subfamily)